MEQDGEEHKAGWEELVKLFLEAEKVSLPRRSKSSQVPAVGSCRQDHLPYGFLKNHASPITSPETFITLTLHLEGTGLSGQWLGT